MANNIHETSMDSQLICSNHRFSHQCITQKVEENYLLCPICQQMTHDQDQNSATFLFEPFKLLLHDLIDQNRQLKQDINQLKEQNQSQQQFFVEQLNKQTTEIKQLQDEINQLHIKNGFGATVFDQEIASKIDDYLASKINELLPPYKRDLKSAKVLDIYVYEDDDDTDLPIAKVKLGMNADYHDLLTALSGTSDNQYPYFSVARRALEFPKEDPSIISAVCRARYASSKFIDTPICLIRHKTEPKKTENQRSTFEEPELYTRQLSRHGKLTSFSLQAPIIEKKTVNVGNLIFIFSESSVNEDIEFKVTTLFPSDPRKFSLSGCICLFKTEIYSNTSNVVELPVVSLKNEPYARLYTLATPTSCWFTSNTRNSRLPMINGIHAFIHHVDIIPSVLSLPPDLFIAAAFERPLTKRNNPVPCTCLLLRERNTDKFPLIAYHGTNINNIQSILLDGLVVPGTVVSCGKRIQPPINHIARKRTYFGVDDYATAIFLSPSIHYSLDPAFAVLFSACDQLLIPVLECSVKHNSYDAYRSAVAGYTARPGDDMNTIDWRVKDPANIEINAVLFIKKIDSTAAARMIRMNKITSSD